MRVWVLVVMLLGCAGSLPDGRAAEGVELCAARYLLDAAAAEGVACPGLLEDLRFIRGPDVVEQYCTDGAGACCFSERHLKVIRTGLAPDVEVRHIVHEVLHSLEECVHGGGESWCTNLPEGHCREGWYYDWGSLDVRHGTAAVELCAEAT